MRAFGNRPFVLSLASAVLFFLYAPLLVIVIFSFTTSPRLSMPIEGLTLDWYTSALSNSLISTALRNSLLLASVSALVSGVIGAAFAFGLVALKRPRLRASLLGASMLPAIMPLLVIGIALAVFFRLMHVQQGLLNAAIGHVLVSLPFVVLTMNARLETFDFSVLEAARDLGATPGVKLKLIDHDDLAPKMNAKYGPLYSAKVIGKSVYPNQGPDNKATAVWNVLLTNDKMSDKDAYDIVKLMVEKKADLVAVHKEAESFSLENQVKGNSSVPWHPGALKYFAEKGVKM